MRRIISNGLAWLVAAVYLTAAGAAGAHALPGTAALFDFGQNSVALELDMPLDQFEEGFKHPVMDLPLLTVERYPAALRAYLIEHVDPVAPDGRHWRVEVESLRVEPATKTTPIDLVAHLRLTPPPGAPLHRFRFNYSVINHEVMTHTVLVFARSDWSNGAVAHDPELLGTIRWLTTGIDVHRDEGSFLQGFVSVFRLGMQHILEGTDHLLFLLALLLPAPLLRGKAWRWGDYGGAKHAAMRLTGLVTAFTLGHSLTLILGAILPVQIPSKPVEVAIAVSILVSALHAWRPLLNGRERWVAAGFGLIHGLAFSQVVAGAGLDGWRKAAAVLGFNLGIEAVQLMVVAVVAPWLILLAKAGRYTTVRLIGAGFAAVASVAWAIERVSGHDNTVSQALVRLPDVAPFLLAGLALAALSARLLPPRLGRRAPA